MVGLALLIAIRIITTTASPRLEDIHRRQLAVIDPFWFPDWLDPRTPQPELLELAGSPMTAPSRGEPSAPA